MSSFHDPSGYERLMGRWSTRLAHELIRFVAMPETARVLDVGCGTGSFAEALLADMPRATVVGVDPSARFIELARERFQDPRAGFETGDAQKIGFRDGAFDAAVAMLVLNFIPDRARAIAEMRRVTRSDGLVAACVWDYGGEMTMLRRFWDAAVAVDPTARGRHEALMPLCRQGELTEQWRGAGLGDVRETGLVIEMPFSSFEDYWSPFLTGVGPAGSHTTSLSPEKREALKRRLLTEAWEDRPESPRVLRARAWAVVGTVGESTS